MIWFCSLCVALSLDILWICTLSCIRDCLAWLYSLDHVSHGTIIFEYNLVQYAIRNRIISHYLLQLCFWRASQDKSWARNTSFCMSFPYIEQISKALQSLGLSLLTLPLPGKKSSPNLDGVEALEGPCSRGNASLCITINMCIPMGPYTCWNTMCMLKYLAESGPQ